MLVNLLLGRLASRGALLAGAVRFRAPADYNLGAAELDAFEQRLEPGLELVVEIIHEDDPGFGDALAVGQGWLEHLGVAGGSDQGNKIAPIAGDIRDHVADDAERRHGLDLVSGGGRANAEQDPNTGKDKPERWAHCGGVFHRSSSKILGSGERAPPRRRKA